MRIAFFETQGWEEKFINEQLGDMDIRFFSNPLSEENIGEVVDFDILCVSLDSKIDEAFLNKLPNLKLVTVRSNNCTNINLDHCNKKKIYVCNIPKSDELLPNLIHTTIGNIKAFLNLGAL